MKLSVSENSFKVVGSGNDVCKFLNELIEQIGEDATVELVIKFLNEKKN